MDDPDNGRRDDTTTRRRPLETIWGWRWFRLLLELLLALSPAAIYLAWEGLDAVLEHFPGGGQQAADPPLLATASCTVHDLHLEAPDAVYLDEPFVIEVRAHWAVGPSFASGDTCSVDASLSGDDAAFTFGQRDLRVDLFTSAARWVVTAEDEGRHALVVSLSSPEGCVQPCEFPMQLPVNVVADRDAAYESARTALEMLVENIHLEVQQDAEISSDAPGSVTLVAGLPPLSQASATFDEISLTVTSSSDHLELPTEAMTLDLTGIGTSEIAIPVTVDAPSARDFPAQIHAVLSGTHQGDTIDASSGNEVQIDVQEQGWIRRNITDNPIAQGVIIGLAIAVGSAVIAKLAAAIGTRRRKAAQTRAEEAAKAKEHRYH